MASPPYGEHMWRGLLVAAVLVGVAACGDPDVDRVAEAAGLYETVTVWSAAFADGDGDTAVEPLAEQCARATGLIRTAVEVTAEQYDGLAPVGFDADVEDNEAEVSYSFANAPELAREGERWILEDGRWRYADC